jgi:chromosome segregation ATPase
MKRFAFFSLLFLLSACNQEELERLKRESLQKQASLDSLKREYDKVNEFKSNVIRDFGESASKLQERLDENRRLEEALVNKQAAIEERNQRIDTLLNTIRLREGDVQSLQRNIGRQESLIQQQETLVKQLQAQLRQKDEQTESLNQALSSRDATVRSLNTTISQRDATIQKLNARIAEQDQTIQSLQKKTPNE